MFCGKVQWVTPWGSRRVPWLARVHALASDAADDRERWSQAAEPRRNGWWCRLISDANLIPRCRPLSDAPDRRDQRITVRDDGPRLQNGGASCTPAARPVDSPAGVVENDLPSLAVRGTEYDCWSQIRAEDADHRCQVRLLVRHLVGERGVRRRCAVVGFPPESMEFSAVLLQHLPWPIEPEIPHRAAHVVVDGRF